MAAEAVSMNPADQRAYIGAAYRVAIDFMRQRGHTAAVKQRVSPVTAALIDKPPSPFTWMPALSMDEIQTALSAVAGREACVELGMAAGRGLGGSVIAPVLRMAATLFGNTPATVFQNLERFYSMVARGMTFAYRPGGESQGTVVAYANGPSVPAALFDVTRGNLRFVFELCGTEGQVDAPEDVRIGTHGAEARFGVRWGTT